MEENQTTQMIDLTFQGPPTFVWEPLIVLALGIAVYFYYKKLSPYPEDLLDRLDSRSISGFGGDRYRPLQGIIVSILAIVFFVAANFSWFLYQLEGL